MKLLPTLPTFFCALLVATASILAAGEEPKPYQVRPVTIWSDGTRMAGDLYLPTDLKDGEKRAAIVFCAGTGGTKKNNGALYGARFAREGFVVLAFDYRGWGESDGKLMLAEPMPKPDEKGEVTVKARPIRWQMDLSDQTFDIRCALSFLAGEPCVDAERLGIFGTSYGGGVVTWVAGNDPRVKCVVVQVPGMGGGRGPAAAKYASDLAVKQARGETEPVPIDTGKLTGKMAAYPQMRVNPAKGIGYSAIEAAAKIKAPTLILVAENEELMNNDANGKRVFEILQGNKVPAEYHVLPGITHYGVYREAFAEATRLEAAWFVAHLTRRDGN
ncbi:MAG: alpha/beta fold hydrolase [Chthoniobacter sp.]|uniref:alpha/beta hydrolase n=1 Tax=Chthoniobacter sp. TaxID=2510640 RepID=UPI0032A34043